MFGNRRARERGLPSSRRATAFPRHESGAPRRIAAGLVVAPPPRGKREREEEGDGDGARSASGIERKGRRISCRDRKGGMEMRGSGEVVTDERRRP
jgi:hypothetical protein